MQIKIYINDKLYKTLTVAGQKYEPSKYFKQIEVDRMAGLLDGFNIIGPMKIEFRKIE